MRGTSSKDEGKLKVFISYSRTDRVFADRLCKGLEKWGLEPKIDTRDLPALEDWRRELLHFIQDAHIVIFVVSAASISSPVCAWEVAQVARLKKRLAPVVLERVTDDRIPDEIAKINYLYFDPPNDFEQQIDKLARALLTDAAWIKEHTRLGEIARRWHERERSPNFLLRGEELSEAERWIASRLPQAPEPTELHRHLILASRQAATRRKRTTIGVSFLSAFLAAVLAGLALWQWWAAVHSDRTVMVERDRAKAETDRAVEVRKEAQLSESLFLAEQATRILAAGDATTAMILAVTALPDQQSEDAAQRGRPYVPEAERALYSAWQARREQRVLRGHSGAIVSAAYSPDGKLIVTASADTTARIWSRGGELLAIMKGHSQGLERAVFSPDGKRILTVSLDKTVRLWNSEGKPLAILQGHESTVRSAVFWPDGKRILTASHDKTARIWNIDGSAIATLSGRAERAVLSPDGQRVLTTIDSISAPPHGAVHLWSADGKILATLHGQYTWSATAVFSPDGKFILSTPIEGIHLWNTNGTLVRTFASTVPTRTAVFSPDSKSFLIALQNGTAQLWGIEGKQLATIVAFPAFANIAFSPDGTQIAATTPDVTVRLWESSTGDLLATLGGHEGSVISVSFSPDGAEILTTGEDGTARLWSAHDLRSKVFSGHDGAAHSAVYSPDGKLIVTASADKTARLWTPDGRLIATLIGHTDSVGTAVFSPDGKRILTSGGMRIGLFSFDRMAKLWDTNGKLLANLEGHGGIVNNAVFSPRGDLIVTSSADKTARLWTAEGALLRTFAGHGTDVLDALFSPDNTRILTISGRFTARLLELPSPDDTARLWDRDGTLITTLVGDTSRVHIGVFSPDGLHILTTSSDNKARIWNKDGKLLKVLYGHRDTILGGVFSPDGHRILTYSRDQTARLWSSDGRLLHAVLEGHNSTVKGAAFSPDGRRIITVAGERGTVSEYKTVRLWTSDGKLLGILKGHKATVNTAVFSPDGGHILTASDDKTVRLWDAFRTTQDLVDRVKGRLPRCLSVSQQAQARLSAKSLTWCRKSG